MRKASRKIWLTVPFRSRDRCLKSESRMDIDEILKAKLATIKEEPEVCEEMGNVVTKHRPFAKKGMKKIHFKAKGRLFKPHEFSFMCSYMFLMTGSASKHGLAGLPHCQL